MHAVDMLLCGCALACAVAAVVAYANLPWEAPMYTGFNGIPSRERVPKIVYLVGIVPLLMLTSLFTITALSNLRGILLAWWGAAMVWNIAEAARGQRRRMPRLVVPGGPYAIVTLIVAGTIAFVTAR